MKYLSKAYTYFIIYGENFFPNELTNKIKIKPTNFGIKGEKSKSGVILKETFWEYQLKKTDALEGIDNSIIDLYKTFEDKISILKDFMIKNKLKSKCYIIIESENEENNGITLTPDFIDFLNKLNTSVEIDIYPQT
jgi:hypothetical protein